MSNEKVVQNEQVQNNAPVYDFDLREMMRYRVNKTSSTLGLLAMVFSMLGAFICLNSMNPDNAQVIFIILLNVVILLGGFLASEKVKAYNIGGAYAQLIFGAVCIGRIFYIPLILVIKYNQFLSSLTYDEAQKTWGVTNQEAYDASAKYLGATIRSKYEGNVANAFLPSSGNFRGIAAMVLFAIAALCFIAAGVIGYKRAKTLNAYMESIKQN